MKRPKKETHRRYTLAFKLQAVRLTEHPNVVSQDIAEATATDGAVIRIEEPGLAVWLSYSGNEKGGNMAWFSHHKDKVTVKNPDEEILAKMHVIASALNAMVQGDEGELYDAAGQPIGQERTSPQGPITAKRPWWKVW